MRADLLEQMEQMGAEDDGRAVAGALQNGVLHAADPERVEAGERLVEEHDARAVQEAAGDGEFLLHAAGEFAGELVGFVGDFEFREKRFGEGLVVGDAVDPRDKIEVLADGEVVEEAGFVGEEGEGAFGGDGSGGEVVAGEADGAGGGGDDAGEAAEGAGFARAVGADQAEDFTRLDGERQVVDGGEGAVAFGETGDRNHVTGSWRDRKAAASLCKNRETPDAARRHTPRGRCFRS